MAAPGQASLEALVRDELRGPVSDLVRRFVVELVREQVPRDGVGNRRKREEFSHRRFVRAHRLQEADDALALDVAAECLGDVDLERVTGSIDDRQGSFLLQDAGTLEGQAVKGDWFVIPGSGTGDLSGLRGEGGFSAQLGQHASITLDYWFE